MRAIGRSGEPRWESPAILHHDHPWSAAPGPKVHDPAGGRAGTWDFGARPGEMPQFAGAGTAEHVYYPIQQEADALWEGDSGRLTPGILSDADRQAIQIRQDELDDDWERQAAADIERSHPHWLVMWGCYSRLFWGFPRFTAPKGTIISAVDPQSLLTEAYQVEANVEQDQPGRAWAVPAALPTR
jgi:hypothetical protein